MDDHEDGTSMELIDFGGGLRSNGTRGGVGSKEEEILSIGSNMRYRGSKKVYTNTADDNGSFDFEHQRKITESKIVSEWPHVQREDVPLLGPDLFPQWFSPPPVFLWYLLAQFSCTFIYSWAVSSITAKFPVTSSDFTFLRSSAIGCTVTIIQLMFGETTGAYLDVYLLWLVVVCNMFFSRKFAPGYEGIISRLLLILQGCMFTLASLGGYYAGPSLTAATLGGGTHTNDCANDFIPLCLARPSVRFVSDTEATYMVFSGHLLVMVATFVAWTVVKRRSLWVQVITKNHIHHTETVTDTTNNNNNNNNNNNDDSSDSTTQTTTTTENKVLAGPKYVAWKINDSWATVSFIIGGAHMLANLLFSVSIGSGPDTLYYVALGTYTNDFSDAKVYAYVGLVAGLVVFLGRLLYHLLVHSVVHYRATMLSSLNYERL